MLVAFFFPVAIAAVLALIGYRKTALGALILACLWAAFLAYGVHACQTNPALIAAAGNGVC